MWIVELCQASPLQRRSVLFREAFYNAKSNSLLAVKKIGTPPKHMFHKSPKSGKQDSKRRSVGGAV